MSRGMTCQGVFKAKPANLMPARVINRRSTARRSTNYCCKPLYYLPALQSSQPTYLNQPRTEPHPHIFPHTTHHSTQHNTTQEVPHFQTPPTCPRDPACPMASRKPPKKLQSNPVSMPPRCIYMHTTDNTQPRTSKPTSSRPRTQVTSAWSAPTTSPTSSPS
jgi:hypothetical protein